MLKEISEISVTHVSGLSNQIDHGIFYQSGEQNIGQGEFLKVLSGSMIDIWITEQVSRVTISCRKLPFVIVPMDKAAEVEYMK